MPSVDTIKPVIEKTLGELGLALYDIRFFRAGSRWILRVFIDKDGGVSIDDCEAASTQLSVVLDVEQFSRRPYTLEVSSPGVDRPLISEQDFCRVVGRMIRLRLKAVDEGAAPRKGQPVTGRLESCTDGIITLEHNNECHHIALADIISGRVEVSFG